ncbi:MAG TPA: DUF6220 domain-containing protein [Arachnia sp.]|nr:DUF6220 domain-containing protein [Arachnia sp.]HMT87119.1 DUF6220 domain-containing protein [Arachnia sp.]
MRKALVVISAVLLAALVLQLYLAGLAFFSTDEENLFGIHGWNGRIVLPVLVLLQIVAAAVGRAGRRTIWLTVIILLLLVFQSLLFVIVGLIFNVGPESPSVPLAASILLGLHPINGLAIMVLTLVVFIRARRLAFPEPAPASA